MSGDALRKTYQLLFSRVFRTHKSERIRLNSVNPMTSRIAVDLIVFDLDGTLADTLPDLTAAANFACRRLGLPEHSPEAIRGMIGGGERKLIERLVGPAHQDRVEECLQLYLDHYTRHNGELTRLYPGVAETLALLSGKKLAVLSNKLQRLTRQTLEAIDIARFFAAIRGGGAGLPLKPAPDAAAGPDRRSGGGTLPQPHGGG